MAVAALYIDPRGPYPKLLGPEFCWDEKRDARSYAGPWPVICHPPCGPWGRLKHLSRNQPREAGPHAVAIVRAFGGVLEHPADSSLWDACNMPKPGELPDAWGGISIEVSQCDYGHPARKRTWLYLVGVRDVPRDPPKRAPTHWVSGGRHRVNGGGGLVPPGIKVCSAQQRRRTPVAFAEFLIDVAAGARNGP